MIASRGPTDQSWKHRRCSYCAKRLPAAVFLLPLIFLCALGGAIRGQGLLVGQAGMQPIQKRPHHRAAIITIRGPVDQVTWTSVRRRVTAARKLGCSLIVYRINSIGGMLSPALRLAHFTRHIGLPTVAYISESAIGPAALVAVSCRQIVMAPRAHLGDGQAFELQGKTAQQAAANPLLVSSSPVLRDLQASARANGYSPAILLAMVDRSIQIDQVRNKLNGQIRFVTPAVRRALVRMQQARPGQAPVHPWFFVRRVKRRGTLLTLGPRRAKPMGICQAEAGNNAALPAILNITGRHIYILRLDFMERLARWLTAPGVRFILFVIMVVCGYIELSHPGLIAPALIALAALALMFGGPMITGLANWWEIALVVLGVLLIIIDIVHFGGLGLLAIPGFLLVLVGLIGSFVPVGESGAGHALQTGISVIVLGLACAMVIILLLVRYLDITPGLRRLALQPATAPDSSRLFREPDAARQIIFVGAIGRAASDLRPAGKAYFGEQLVDVVADGEFIARARVVEITRITENQVMVCPVPEKG